MDKIINLQIDIYDPEQLKSIDLERWLNELTHKYIAIIALAAYYCWRPPILIKMQIHYEFLRYGTEEASFSEDNKQIVRRPQQRFLSFTPARLVKFSKQIDIAKKELDEFIKKNEI